jgi:hypothetical protein
MIRAPQFAVRAGSLAMIAFVVAMTGSGPSGADPSSASTTLRNAAAFSSISNQADRSRALFEEIGKVLTNPRCMNCHPAGDHPLQGDDSHEHVPPIWRAETGHFEVNCSGCHGGKNFSLHEAATYRSIPGHPRWGFAPLSMAWEGKSLGEICRQLKDVQLNGVVTSPRCRNTSPRMISSRGGGIPAKAASRLRAASRRRANWCRPGSIAAPSAHADAGSYPDVAAPITRDAELLECPMELPGTSAVSIRSKIRRRA